MVYAGLDYFPVIFLANPETADLTKAPIIAVGEEVCGIDDSDDGDKIAGWMLESTCIMTELLIGESAYKGTNPVIIVSFTTDIPVNEGSGTSGTGTSGVDSVMIQDSTGNKPSTNYAYYFVSRYRISERFEKCTNESELNIAFHTYGTFGNSDKNEYPHKRIANVHKNNIGNYYNCWVSIPYLKFGDDQRFINYEDSRLLAVTYEYDGHCSGKPFKVYDPVTGVFRTLSLNMKYGGDWYQTFSVKLDKTMVYSGWYYDQIEGKGRTTFHHWD